MGELNNVAVAALTLAAAAALLLAFIMMARAQYERKDVARQRELADENLSKAKEEAERLKRQAIVEGREEVLKLREDAEAELKQQRQEAQRSERRIEQREEGLERRLTQIDSREKDLVERETRLQDRHQELDALLERQRQELERVSGLSADQAREMLLKQVQDDVQHETAKLIKDAEEDYKQRSDQLAREIITQGIQRCAVDHVVETTVSTVALPSDDMKGRIVGREGRNIRAFENITGVDLIVDDTPEAVVLSSFDPIRREVARVSLERLVSDGRIHPGRIESVVEKARTEMEQKIREAGDRATFDVGVSGLHPELVRMLGRLKYRTSYGQNALQHSIEVAHLSAIMAAELDAKVHIAKRAGLLHDLGKAVDFESEGPHAQLGAELAQRYKESPEVVHGIAAHHAEVEIQTVEAALVQAADAISAARPGARRESLESYVKRLEKLEHIADQTPGVDKAFAIQAGREVRILVKPEQVDDVLVAKLARDIASRIEEELDYPGQIRVTVIRETRVVEYAK